MANTTDGASTLTGFIEYDPNDFSNDSERIQFLFDQNKRLRQVANNWRTKATSYAEKHDLLLESSTRGRVERGTSRMDELRNTLNEMTQLTRAMASVDPPRSSKVLHALASILIGMSWGALFTAMSYSYSGMCKTVGGSSCSIMWYEYVPLVVTLIATFLIPITPTANMFASRHIDNEHSKKLEFRAWMFVGTCIVVQFICLVASFGMTMGTLIDPQRSQFFPAAPLAFAIFSVLHPIGSFIYLLVKISDYLRFDPQNNSLSDNL